MPEQDDMQEAAPAAGDVGTTNGHDAAAAAAPLPPASPRRRSHSHEGRKERRDEHRDDRRDERKERKRSKYRSRSRSRSRDRRKERRRSRSRSRSRDRRRRSRSRSRDRRRRHSRSRSRDGRRRRSRSRSSDGLGGYKPRKRQEPPRPTASMFATNDPFAHLRVKTPTDPAEAARMWQEQMLRARQRVLEQQAKSAVQIANKSAREIYIGNVIAGVVTDEMLAEVFNSALGAAFPAGRIPGQEPVIKAQVHSDGRYAFIELRTAEYATAALQLDGQINLMGSALSIGRPAAYIDPDKVQEAAAQAEAALTAFKRGGEGLPIVPGATLPGGQPGSVGAAMAAAGKAAADGHNAAAVAAGTLSAAQAQGPGVPPQPAAAAADASSLLAPGVVPGLLQLQTGMLAAGLPKPPALCCLVVIGMVSEAMLKDDEEYEEILLDLKDECARHGEVAGVAVPRPAGTIPGGPAPPPELVGKAYVRFKAAAGAAAAREALLGRLFAGVRLHAALVPDSEYEAAAAVSPAL